MSTGALLCVNGKVRVTNGNNIAHSVPLCAALYPWTSNQAEEGEEAHDKRLPLSLSLPRCPRGRSIELSSDCSSGACPPLAAAAGVSPL